MTNFIKHIIFKISNTRPVFRKYNSLNEYSEGRNYCDKCRTIEKIIIENQEETSVDAFCSYCKKWRKMKVDFAYSRKDSNGRNIPNFRERLECASCNLNSRLRATIHFLDSYYSNIANCKTYITEETTHFFEMLKKKYPFIVGSEYMLDAKRGDNMWSEKYGKKINNQDLTDLTFKDSSFDLVLSFDVLEHIPEYKKAISEIFRVITDSGSLIFSVPFDLNSEKNVVRAKIKNGVVHHILPPQYHGDPMNGDGCLSYYCFGWELLKDLKEAGFRESGVYVYQSSDYGYISEGLILYANK